jgi:serine phosphatase RsbU (regulator of sigma subunit)
MYFIETEFDIQGSLKYAEFLQNAIFPKQRHFDRIFSDSFILFKPLHYVSGDFFWITEINDLIYVVVGDCAGHGVPGAILSVLMYSLLDYAILNKRLKKTHKIIEEIDKRFVDSFSAADTQKPFDNEWVDISLCCIERKTQTVYFTGCKRDLLYLSKAAATVYKGTPYHIGDWMYNTKGCFSSINFKYQEGESIYLGTDGFQDQIGGCKSKKYQKSRLHNLIACNAHLPMSTQKQILENELTLWMKGYGQTDDICVVGIRL